ncbi:MAG: TPM domain-containing protein [Azonexus sp.]|nr:TPM domain-containing protein [Azonexus sp.]
MKLLRILKHLSAPSVRQKPPLSDAALDAITARIAEGESTHRGEIRVVIEGPLPLGVLWREESSRQRAADLFATCGVGNTRNASGILLYIQWLERRVEILADQGITACVPQSEWDALCRSLTQAFSEGAPQYGLLAAVDRMNALLSAHFPTAPMDDSNELENRPLVI